MRMNNLLKLIERWKSDTAGILTRVQQIQKPTRYRLIPLGHRAWSQTYEQFTYKQYATANSNNRSTVHICL